MRILNAIYLLLLISFFIYHVQVVDELYKENKIVNNMIPGLNSAYFFNGCYDAFKYMWLIGEADQINQTQVENICNDLTDTRGKR